jgi:hypothetical protein
MAVEPTSTSHRLLVLDPHAPCHKAFFTRLAEAAPATATPVGDQHGRCVFAKVANGSKKSDALICPCVTAPKKASGSADGPAECTSGSGAHSVGSVGMVAAQLGAGPRSASCNSQRFSARMLSLARVLGLAVSYEPLAKLPVWTFQHELLASSWQLCSLLNLVLDGAWSLEVSVSGCPTVLEGAYQAARCGCCADSVFGKTVPFGS